jgi:hypothetical protein
MIRIIGSRLAVRSLTGVLINRALVRFLIGMTITRFFPH